MVHMAFPPNAIPRQGTHLTAKLSQYEIQGSQVYRFTFDVPNLPQIQAKHLGDKNEIMDSIRRQLLFMVYANDIRQMQADCFSLTKKHFIYYAVDTFNRKNQILAVDPSKLVSLAINFYCL